MGVDGFLSAGWTPNPIVTTFMLQADSTSNDMFERWYQAEQTIREKYVASGSIILPATGRKYALTRGFLTNYAPTPAGKKTLQPRSFAVTWQRITQASF